MALTMMLYCVNVEQTLMLGPNNKNGFSKLQTTHLENKERSRIEQEPILNERRNTDF
jgi:hypothetical protein